MFLSYVVILLFFVFVVVGCFGATTSNNHDNKKLVILAGPHQTSGDDIRYWFDRYATDYKTNSTTTSSSNNLGGGWKWPTLEEKDLLQIQTEHDISRHSIFKLLFQEDNNDPDILLQSIRYAWDTAERGVIIGHERFDKLGGETPHTQMDALKVIYRIVEDLSIPRENVIFVLVYETPRLQQWIRIWKIQSHHKSYQDFVCQDDEADKRQEYVSTAMNIGSISNDLLHNGFNVVVIDEEGTKQSNLDLSHTLVCNVLDGVDCTPDGWITHLKDKHTKVSLQDDSQFSELTKLSLPQLYNLETMFLKRECVYQSNLQNNERFRILNQNTMLSECDIPNDISSKVKLMDTDFAVNYIQKQNGCATPSFDPSGVLPSVFPTDNGGRNKSTSGQMIGEYFLIIVLLLLSGTGAFLVFLLYKSFRKAPEEGKSDGMFSESTPRSCLFRKRHNSEEGSTEGSTDEETPPSSPSKDMKDISLQKSTSSISKSDLCKACKLVRIDPDCPFCHGGQQQLPPRSPSLRSKSFKSHVPPNRNENDSTHGAVSWESTDSAIESVEDFKFGTQKAELSPRKTKTNGRSRAFRKLKELTSLKNKKETDNEEVLNPDNLQMDRDDESVVSVT